MTFLLAMLVAGTITYAVDAYAQSNTERIKIIQDNTDGLRDTVHDISMTLGSIPESLQSTLLTSLSSFSNDISTITESSVNVESAITKFTPTLDQIAASVQTNRETLSDLTNIMASMNADILVIKSALTGESGSELGTNVEVLTTTVNRNEVTISNRLDKIEAAIQSLEAQLTNNPTTAVQTTGLTRQSESVDISSYSYKSQNNVHKVSGKDVYVMRMSFSCTGPVSIDEVTTDLTSATRWILPDSNPFSGTDENYLKVNNRDVYNSRAELSSNTYSVLNRGLDLNLQSLSAGATLEFVSQQYEQNNRIKDAKNTANDGYTLTVSYLGNPSTKCSFKGIGGASSGTLAEKGSVILTGSLSPSSFFYTFSVGATCSDVVEITSLTVETTESWNKNLARFADVDVIAGSKTTSIEFTNDGSALKTNQYPISSGAGDLRINGQLPFDSDATSAQVLILMSYNTVTGGACIAKTT